MKTTKEIARTFYPEMNNCPICKLEVELPVTNHPSHNAYSCDFCGEFYMSFELASEKLIDTAITDNKHILRGYIQNLKEKPFFKTKADLQTIVTNYAQLNNASYKVDYILKMIQNEKKQFGVTIRILPDNFPKYYCESAKELQWILMSLEEKKLIRLYTNQSVGTIASNSEIISWDIQVTLEGVIYNDSKKIDSKQCFIAMWFDPQVDVVFDSVKNVFEDPILKDKKFTLQRIDNKIHSNDITDEILFEIKRSKFLIADLSGTRGGVYFEAGFAKGLGLPVILTCNSIHEKDVHFDLRNRPILYWEKDKMLEFEKRLLYKICAEIL